MRLPEWIRARHEHSAQRPVKGLMRTHGLKTVCEEARCPNMTECFSKPTAAFMVLGDRCTRDCGFCAVSPGAPLPPDPEEPRKVALAAKEMGLKYVVITSVTRDDLPDGGAAHFADTIRELKSLIPSVGVEVLTPDFGGREGPLITVLASGPNVFNHNVETVPRLYGTVRPGADYARSLGVVRKAKENVPGLDTKSGLMVGLGESREEVIDVMRDLRDAGCDIITIGQYLRPARVNLPVAEYVTPGEFQRLKEEGLGMGFRHVASGPLVRSSMNAGEVYQDV